MCSFAEANWLPWPRPQISNANDVHFEALQLSDWRMFSALPADPKLASRIPPEAH
jgi:hypothetical protein